MSELTVAGQKIGRIPDASSPELLPAEVPLEAGNLVLEANLSGFLASHEAMSGRFDDARAHIAHWPVSAPAVRW